MSYQPIENYGIIGDLHTVALVGMNGAIDFMCYPHFDSPTLFAALLDHRKGGSFQIAPLHDGVQHKQMYLPDTNMLLTRFLSREGVAELSDFMPVQERGHVHRLVRRIKTVKGCFKYRLLCDPRFDYGRSQHRSEVRENGVLFFQDEERTFFYAHLFLLKSKTVRRWLNSPWRTVSQLHSSSKSTGTGGFRSRRIPTMFPQHLKKP